MIVEEKKYFVRTTTNMVLNLIFTHKQEDFVDSHNEFN
ncbi:hypothetical protein CoNPh26_CDS0068 [Staphylococcus phage S-CoN_Ph26]|nr:hypothetical protein CoNPh26_CDS0068 [Staphylococcus phage S-CoN_Ph26]